jgi:hypothetical protein
MNDNGQATYLHGPQEDREYRHREYRHMVEAACRAIYGPPLPTGYQPAVEDVYRIFQGNMNGVTLEQFRRDIADQQKANQAR